MILLGLGSNLGDRADFLAQARMALLAFDVDVLAESSIIETPALVPEGAPADWHIPYLNQVLAVRTDFAPEELLACIKHIEQELGRKPTARWAPREIDIDILAYEDMLMVSDMLTLPHPQLDSRDFVLTPILEIAPHWRHPVFDKTASELLAELRG
ncbi:MAG: 2-amino-4-hydroxy-6-hydroxymethyldihydropteridine diphosphokinase [Pseudomonadota bacterium]